MPRHAPPPAISPSVNIATVAVPDAIDVAAVDRKKPEASLTEKTHHPKNRPSNGIVTTIYRPYLVTTISRPDEDGDPVPVDVAVGFTINKFTPGSPARIWGDPLDCWPAEPAEYEFAFADAAVLQEAGPWSAAVVTDLTAAERDRLRAWFDQQYPAAWAEAEALREDESKQ